MPVGRVMPEAPKLAPGSSTVIRVQAPLRAVERDGETIIGIDLPPAPVVPTADEVAELVPVPKVPTLNEIVLEVERLRPPAPPVRDIPAWVWRLEDLQKAGHTGLFRIDANGDLKPMQLEVGEGIGLVDDPVAGVIRVHATALSKRVAALEEAWRTLSSISNTVESPTPPTSVQA